MISRRTLIKWLGRMALTGLGTSTYAFAVEPALRLRTVTYAFTPPRWTDGLKLRIVMLADPHLVEPHVPLSRWKRIIDLANTLEPDLILLMGDYAATHRFRTKLVPMRDTAHAAKELRAHLGVYAICGNHDWWQDADAQARGKGPTHTQIVLEEAGIPVLENKAVRIDGGSKPFWLTGTASIVAVRHKGGFDSRANLTGTLAMVTDDAPIIHLAHEPDLFVDMPDRVSLTLAGHTHGGQVRLFGYSPVVPSQFGNRFAYGHIVEEGRHLIVSAGIGCSILPVRLGMPPELTVVELG